MGRSAPQLIRTRILKYVHQSPNTIERLSNLAILGEPISEIHLAETVHRIFDSIRARVQMSVEGNRQIKQLSFGGVGPRDIIYFKDILPPNLHTYVVDGLLEVVINRELDLSTRNSAIFTLAHLPREVVSYRAEEVLEFLLLGLEQKLEIGTFTEDALASVANPFSGSRMNFGNLENVHRSALRVLGQLYPLVERSFQSRIIQQIVAGGRHQSEVIRTGAAMALDALESSEALPNKLFFTLVALVHDPDSNVCGWACAASARLMKQGIVEPYKAELVERIIELATVATDIDVRRGATVGLRILEQSTWPDEEIRQRINRALAQLGQDMSHQVRRAAIGPPNES